MIGLAIWANRRVRPPLLPSLITSKYCLTFPELYHFSHNRYSSGCPGFTAEGGSCIQTCKRKGFAKLVHSMNAPQKRSKTR